MSFSHIIHYYIVDQPADYHAPTFMYCRCDQVENQPEQCGEFQFGLLEKSNHFFHSQKTEEIHLQSFPDEFQEVMLMNIQPQGSSVSKSTSTASEQSQGMPVWADDFGQSLDCFLCNFDQPEAVNQAVDGSSASNSSQKQTKIQHVNSRQFLEDMDEEKEERNFKTHDETKNIPKNFMKAILTFILQNNDYVTKLITHINSSNNQDKVEQVTRFLEFVKEEKRIKKYTIERLKDLWTHSAFGKAMRVISSEFLRRRSLHYIFGSKIENKRSHVKHRGRLMRAIENPSQFSSIK